MTYRRLLAFLRPHAWRMAGTIACNFAAAALDVFSFTLLVPFLDRLFNQASPTAGVGASAGNWIAELQQRIVGLFVSDADPRAALVHIVIVILLAVTIKNLFVWISGQLGAQL